MNTFYLNGQRAWYHDEGHDSGYFHTYDGLVVEPNRDAPRKVHVFLPRDYESANQHYPVIYMNDGNAIFWPGGESAYSWDVPNTLSELYRHQHIQPVIIVAIYPLNRAYEYLHVQEFSSPLQKEGGGLPDYAAYLVRLKQFIDGGYRTVNSSEVTTIIGASHGGLASFYTGSMYGKYFGKVGALSSTFGAGGISDLRQSQLINLVGQFLQPSNPHRPQLWIDWGLNHSAGGYHNFYIEAEATKWGRAMVDLLQQDYAYTLGMDLFKYEDEWGVHDERSWAYRFKLILQQYYGI